MQTRIDARQESDSTGHVCLHKINRRESSMHSNPRTVSGHVCSARTIDSASNRLLPQCLASSHLHVHTSTAENSTGGQTQVAQLSAKTLARQRVRRTHIVCQAFIVVRLSLPRSPNKALRRTPHLTVSHCKAHDVRTCRKHTGARGNDKQS